MGSKKTLYINEIKNTLDVVNKLIDEETYNMTGKYLKEISCIIRKLELYNELNTKYGLDIRPDSYLCDSYIKTGKVIKYLKGNIVGYYDNKQDVARRMAEMEHLYKYMYEDPQTIKDLFKEAKEEIKNIPYLKPNLFKILLTNTAEEILKKRLGNENIYPEKFDWIKV